MSLRRNVLANYIGQFYGTLLGVIMVPTYVRYMGVEAYGLIGFFAVLQIWFQLLDIGLTQTLAREAARLISDRLGGTQKLRKLVRSLEIVFICVALVASGVLIFGSAYIAETWLKIKLLPPREVQLSVELMAVNIGVRWVSGLYRGAITGLERLVWLTGLNILSATARFLPVILVFILFGISPVYFFGYQLIVAVLELGIVAAKTYSLLPSNDLEQDVRWDGESLRKVFKFSLSMALANLVLVMTTQVDKLLLSRLLPLDVYAYFALCTLMANGIFMLSNPFGIALLPRLTRLAITNHDIELRALYRESTQLVAVIIIPAAMIMSFFSQQVLWVWTGNLDLVQRVAPVLSLYALGNCIVALSTFPYYLQFAKGDLRLHLLGSLLLLVVMVPALSWSTMHFGVIGAGYAWLGANALYFLFWIPTVHGKFEKGLHTLWLLQDVGAILIPCSIVAILIYYAFAWPPGRIAEGMYTLVFGVLLLGIASASSSQIRKKIGSRLRRKFH